MAIACPSCRKAIAIEDINVSTDLALCRSCGHAFSFAELARGSAATGSVLNSPPGGAWFEQWAEGFRVGATTRSWMALLLVPFSCVWAGGSLYGIYGRQILNGRFSAIDSLFGIPFLLGSCVLVWLCAMNLAGEVEITRRGDELSVFTGIGGLGWTRSYNWSDFSFVREDRSRGSINFNGSGSVVVLEGRRRAAFGSMLSDERRYFVLSALRNMVRDSQRAQGAATIVPHVE